MKVETTSKRPIDFDKIRCGTVFTNNGETFIKINGENDKPLAVNLETGQLDTPISKFKECYIYPRAIIKLNGEPKKST
jgi:hypothetical protein